MDKELQEKLYRLDWESILTELYAYAYARRNYPGLQHHLSPEDLVDDAVARVLSGERKWDCERHPDVVIHLKAVIKSLTNKAWKSEKAARRRDEAIKNVQDGETAQAQMDRLETESSHKSLLEDIEAELDEDEDILLMFYAMKEGHLKDQELAAELGIEITAVRNAKKRMRRKLTDLKPRSDNL